MISFHVLAVVFGILGNVISFLVFLAPVPTFHRIYKKKSTESFQSLPYQVALFSCMLWLYYALIKQNAFLLITINSFGCVVETIYIAMFLAYASREKRVSAMKLFLGMNVALFSLILVVTHFLVKDSDRRVTVLGWICVTFAVSVFAAPLTIVARVIRTKSVEFMPFTLSLFLTLSAVMWFAYGVFLKDICIAIPNIIGLLLGMVQMILYGVFRNSNKHNFEKKLPEQELKSVVVLVDHGAAKADGVKGSEDVKEERGLSESDDDDDDPKNLAGKPKKREQPANEEGKCHVEHVGEEAV